MKRITALAASLLPASCAAPLVAPCIVAGPTLLDREIEVQWGAHSCTYLLEGESGTFCCAASGPRT